MRSHTTLGRNAVASVVVGVVATVAAAREFARNRAVDDLGERGMAVDRLPDVRARPPTSFRSPRIRRDRGGTFGFMYS